MAAPSIWRVIPWQAVGVGAAVGVVGYLLVRPTSAPSLAPPGGPSPTDGGPSPTDGGLGPVGLPTSDASAPATTPTGPAVATPVQGAPYTPLGGGPSTPYQLPGGGTVLRARLPTDPPGSEVLAQHPLTSAPPPPPPPTVGGSTAPALGLSDEAFARQMLAAVNAQRARGGVCGGRSFPASRPLEWDTRLAAASLRLAQDLARRGLVSHVGADGSTMAQRINAAGYRYFHAGENAAAGDRTVADVMVGWMHSPGHCANILEPQVTQMGAAVVRGVAPYEVYWVQDFAAPA